MVQVIFSMEKKIFKIFGIFGEYEISNNIKMAKNNPVMSNVMNSAKFIIRKCMWLHNQSIYITENLFDLKFPFRPKWIKAKINFTVFNNYEIQFYKLILSLWRKIWPTIDLR